MSDFDPTGSPTKDRLSGMADDLKGRGKSAFGELTGDEQTQAEGEADQAGGQAKQGMANVKDKIDEAVKKVTGSGS